MTPAAYLDADAARLGDAELPRTVPLPVPVRTVPDHVLFELDYAVDLFRRADHAISKELPILRGLHLDLDWSAVHAACFTLVSAAMAMHLHALGARAGRPA